MADQTKGGNVSILGIDWASYDRGVGDALNGEPADEAGNALYEEGYDGASYRWRPSCLWWKPTKRRTPCHRR